jgi:hypothetical protein
MSYREALSQHAISISISDSPDMAFLGLSEEHLRDAMAEIARHLLALGARLIYGGDLREHGFSKLLFELVARHGRDANEGDGRASVANYLAWPVHIRMAIADLEKFNADLEGSAELILVALNGTLLSLGERQRMVQNQATDGEWASGLTAMRQVMLSITHARIVLGGRVEQYKGVMPGIAEEALLSLQARQPLYLIGGFGGCSRDIAEMLGLVSPLAVPCQEWQGREEFNAFTVADLNNGLTAEQNITLANTPHVDQAITLILMGLLRLRGKSATRT